MKASDIAGALGGHRVGTRWIARCPAHEDRSPSLSISERDGRILAHCFAGCPQAAVICALRARGLWPIRERPAWTAAQRRAWRERRDRAEAVAQRAYAWAHGRCIELEQQKAAALEAGDMEKLAAAARLLNGLHNGAPGLIVSAFERATAEDPGGAAETEAAGTEDLDHAARVTAALVAVIAAPSSEIK